MWKISNRWMWLEVWWLGKGKVQCGFWNWLSVGMADNLVNCSLCFRDVLLAFLFTVKQAIDMWPWRGSKYCGRKYISHGSERTRLLFLHHIRRFWDCVSVLWLLYILQQSLRKWDDQSWLILAHSLISAAVYSPCFRVKPVLSLGVRQGTPWIGYQSIKGQPSTHIHTYGSHAHTKPSCFYSFWFSLVVTLSQLVSSPIKYLLSLCSQGTSEYTTIRQEHP